MNAFSQRDTRPAAVEMIGVLMVFWSFLAFIPAPSLFYRTLKAYGSLATSAFFFVLFVCGTVLIFCSWLRVAERFLEAALVVCAMAIFAAFTPFLLAGVITPVTITMPYLGVCCLRLMMRDFSRW